MQIAQIVVGTTYALIHLIISYDVPVSVPYNVISSFPSASSLRSSATSLATAASSAGVGSILKKLALRAAGEEGLAENVPKAHLAHLGRHSATEKLREQIKYRTVLQPVPCLHSSGQVFAIALNVIYLLPLTYVPSFLLYEVVPDS